MSPLWGVVQVLTLIEYAQCLRVGDGDEVEVTGVADHKINKTATNRTTLQRDCDNPDCWEGFENVCVDRPLCWKNCRGGPDRCENMNLHKSSIALMSWHCFKCMEDDAENMGMVSGEMKEGLGTKVARVAAKTGQAISGHLPWREVKEEAKNFLHQFGSNMKNKYDNVKALGSRLPSFGEVTQSTGFKVFKVAASLTLLACTIAFPPAGAAITTAGLAWAGINAAIDLYNMKQAGELGWNKKTLKFAVINVVINGAAAVSGFPVTGEVAQAIGLAGGAEAATAMGELGVSAGAQFAVGVGAGAADSEEALRDVAGDVKKLMSGALDFEELVVEGEDNQQETVQARFTSITFVDVENDGDKGSFSMQKAAADLVEAGLEPKPIKRVKAERKAAGGRMRRKPAAAASGPDQGWPAPQQWPASPPQGFPAPQQWPASPPQGFPAPQQWPASAPQQWPAPQQQGPSTNPFAQQQSTNRFAQQQFKSTNPFAQ